jgi:hypothetical protein
VRKDTGKYVFFDFENKWQQRVTSDEQIEMDPAQIENELVVQMPQPAQLQTGGGANQTHQQLAFYGAQ